MRILPTVKKYVPVPTITGTIILLGDSASMLIINGEYVLGGVRDLIPLLGDMVEVEVASSNYNTDTFPRNWKSRETVLKLFGVT